MTAVKLLRQLSSGWAVRILIYLCIGTILAAITLFGNLSPSSTYAPLSPVCKGGDDDPHHISVGLYVGPTVPELMGHETEERNWRWFAQQGRSIAVSHDAHPLLPMENTPHRYQDMTQLTGAYAVNPVIGCHNTGAQVREMSIVQTSHDDHGAGRKHVVKAVTLVNNQHLAFLRSTDGGVTWNSSQLELPEAMNEAKMVSATPLEFRGVVYVFVSFAHDDGTWIMELDETNSKLKPGYMAATQSLNRMSVLTSPAGCLHQNKEDLKCELFLMGNNSEDTMVIFNNSNGITGQWHAHPHFCGIANDPLVRCDRRAYPRLPGSAGRVLAINGKYYRPVFTKEARSDQRAHGGWIQEEMRLELFEVLSLGATEYREIKTGIEMYIQVLPGVAEWTWNSLGFGRVELEIQRDWDNRDRVYVYVQGLQLQSWSIIHILLPIFAYLSAAMLVMGLIVLLLKRFGVGPSIALRMSGVHTHELLPTHDPDEHRRGSGRYEDLRNSRTIINLKRAPNLGSMKMTTRQRATSVSDSERGSDTESVSSPDVRDLEHMDRKIRVNSDSRTGIGRAMNIRNVLFYLAMAVVTAFVFGYSYYWAPFYFDTGRHDVQDGSHGGFTAMIVTHHGRLPLLREALAHYTRCDAFTEVVLVWQNTTDMIPDLVEDLDADNLSIPVYIRTEHVNSMNNRWKEVPNGDYADGAVWPYNAVASAIFSVDDDILIPCEDVERGFINWRSHPERLTGFLPRVIYPDLNGVFRYGHERDARRQNHYNMVLPSSGFFGGELLHRYQKRVPNYLKNLVDEVRNCEDILINFVFGEEYQEPPMAVPARTRDRSVIKDYGKGISHAPDHVAKRERCIAEFTKWLGHFPLHYANFDDR
eukprot:Clim_evm5s229 gene=Clim_evmTU5s229